MRWEDAIVSYHTLLAFNILPAHYATAIEEDPQAFLSFHKDVQWESIENSSLEYEVAIDL